MTALWLNREMSTTGRQLFFILLVNCKGLGKSQ